MWPKFHRLCHADTNKSGISIGISGGNILAVSGVVFSIGRRSASDLLRNQGIFQLYTISMICMETAVYQQVRLAPSSKLKNMYFRRDLRRRAHSPLHHSSDQLQHPGGMAFSPSPAASDMSCRGSSVHPRARPLSRPKAKFSLEDDAALIELKEKHELEWKKDI